MEKNAFQRGKYDLSSLVSAPSIANGLPLSIRSFCVNDMYAARSLLAQMLHEQALLSLVDSKIAPLANVNSLQLPTTPVVSNGDGD